MVYLFGQVWLLMTSPTWVMETIPQLSLAVTEVMSAAGTSLAHLTVRLAGQVMLGLVTSWTVIVWLTRPDSLPQASTAFQVRSEEHTSELQSQSHISYAVFC